MEKYIDIIWKLIHWFQHVLPNHSVLKPQVVLPKLKIFPVQLVIKINKSHMQETIVLFHAYGANSVIHYLTIMLKTIYGPFYYATRLPCMLKFVDHYYTEYFF